LGFAQATDRAITRTFDIDMVVRDKKTKLPGKLHFVSNFNVSSSFVSNFSVFSYVSLFVVDAWWTSYGTRVPDLQRLSI
jgi:hypothetical protein